jgi:hypothetical protein
LVEKHWAEIVTVTMDPAKGRFEEVRDRAGAGRSARSLIDAREDSRDSFCLPSLQARYMRAGIHLRARSAGLSWPSIS